MDSKQNIGYLVVNVVTARGAIPLQGAAVTVLDSEAEGVPVVSVVHTDSSGKTERIALSAPDRSLSTSPGSGHPFATYMIKINKEGYYPVTNSGIPIFEGITSIQPVEMLPLAEYDSDSVYPRVGLDIEENEGQNL
ncbi:MAG: hypothetical protein HFE63_02635 [Clostridiales bacterium]|nr:hypothetical protein [Clostridiales bacterium]